MKNTNYTKMKDVNGGLYPFVYFVPFVVENLN